MAHDRAQNPPTPATVELLELQPNVPHPTRFLAPYRGCLFHWHAGRSWPCPGPHQCAQSIHRARTVWRGFAPAERWDDVRRLWFPGVQPVTEALEEALRGRTLRGEVWLLTRTEEGRKAGPVKGTYCERQPEECLPPAFDMMPVLLRALHVDSLLLGVPNPLPAKVVLEASAGPAPNLPAEVAPAAPPELSPQEKARIREQMQKQMGRRGGAARPETPPAGTNGHASAPGD